VTLDEIVHFIEMLDNEVPTNHFGWLQFQKDCRQVLLWLHQLTAEEGKATPLEHQITMLKCEKVLLALYNRADERINNKVAKPRFCLNPLGEVKNVV